jgi:hypothetical protein
MSQLGKQFMVSPTTLAKPLKLFKPTKVQWNDVKSDRGSHEAKKKASKEKGVLISCCFHRQPRDGDSIIRCKFCYLEYHRSCLIARKENISSFYCKACSAKYMVTSRPAIKDFKQMEDMIESEGNEMRKAKREKNLEARKALQQGAKKAKEVRRHDLKAGERHTTRGIKKRAVTRSEKDAMQDLDAMDIDIDIGIVQANNLENEDGDESDQEEDSDDDLDGDIEEQLEDSLYVEEVYDGDED